MVSRWYDAIDMLIIVDQSLVLVGGGGWRGALVRMTIPRQGRTPLRLDRPHPPLFIIDINIAPES